MSGAIALPSADAGLLARDARTMCEALMRTASNHAAERALTAVGDPMALTWNQYRHRVESIAGGLDAVGVQRADTVALLLKNRPESFLVDGAAMCIGAIPFSLYASSSAEQTAYVINHAAPGVIVTESAFVPKLMSLRPQLSSVTHVVVVDDDDSEVTMTLTDLEQRSAPGFDFDRAWRAAQPSDVLTLIYTSGTTGPPKGVELTHDNILSTLRNFDQIVPMLRPRGRYMSYLPMAHIADRLIALYVAQLTGGSTICVPDPSSMNAALVEARPTTWLGIPRVWEKMKSALEAKRGINPSTGQTAGTTIRESLGLNQAEVLLSGAAPISPDVLKFFLELGLPILECWGMTETTGSATVNPPGNIRVGTVGKPLPNTEFRLAADGEIMVRGGTVMRGYRADPEKTAETIDPSGWLATGDIGRFDVDGYLTIVDRKKELIINAAGKNMSPANIEEALKSAGPLIGQACVIGDQRPYNVALLVLDSDLAVGLDPNDSKVVSKVQAEVDAANTRLARVEQIRRFELLGEEWLPGGAELTPTMKLRRKPIAEKYAAQIDALYQRS